MSTGRVSVPVLVALVVLTTANEYTSTEEVDYYEKLITEEIERASRYQFPKDARQYKPENTYPEEFGQYDYVIIGGGSAGSVVASRLSEVGIWNVLLLEAGKEENNFTDIPSMAAYSVSLDYNWGFNSTPQSTCCLAMGGACPFPRGRSLGGTSAINSMIYTRGNREDYDRWAAMGNPGWSYEEVLPYFMKSENANITGDAGYHGFGGPLDINYHYPISHKVENFEEANQEWDIPVVDYNGREQLGVGTTHFTTVSGRRESSAKAFLGPARNRHNLNVITESYVTNILISNSSKTVEGVLFSHKKTLYIVRVTREVVLSAGVIGSPQLLMLSGIGPKEHLTNLGIPVVEDLAVGQGMHDHLTFYNLYFHSSHPEPHYSLRQAIQQYLNGTGPLTTANSQALGFYHLEFTSSGSPDIEVVFVPSVNLAGFDVVKRGVVQGYVDHSTSRQWGRSGAENYIFQMLLVLLHPKTRGSVSLKSSDPYEYPLINSACLADPDNEDIENLYKGIQAALKLTETEAFAQLDITLLPSPYCLDYSFNSREYWICVIRQTAMNAYHGGGTCSMGPDPANGAVVDHKLKVHGVTNLRVADTSVVPVTTAAHMNAPAIMIGERVADFIKEENKCFKVEPGTFC